MLGGGGASEDWGFPLELDHHSPSLLCGWRLLERLKLLSIFVQKSLLGFWGFRSISNSIIQDFDVKISWLSLLLQNPPTQD